MMRQLANAHSVTGPPSSIYRASFSGIRRDRSTNKIIILLVEYLYICKLENMRSRNSLGFPGNMLKSNKQIRKCEVTEFCGITEQYFKV